MAIVRPYLLKLTLNVNELNPPIKRHKVNEFFKEPIIYCLQETCFTSMTFIDWK
jgi:hypothetical protein